MTSSFIFNGVCIKWVGWIDLHSLNGKAKLVYDVETAAVSELCLCLLNYFHVEYSEVHKVL